MKALAAIALISSLPSLGRAAEINLATLTCGKYENEVLPAAAANPSVDSIDTVMWLFGYSVAKTGAHILYTDGLAPFGFALDGECKSNPRESMLDAVAAVKIESKSPMDISGVECGAFAARHSDFARSDAESATTIMMWLFGFSVAASGSHIFNADLLSTFETTLLSNCAKRPNDYLLDVLHTINPAKLTPGSKPTPASKPAAAPQAGPSPTPAPATAPVFKPSE